MDVPQKNDDTNWPFQFVVYLSYCSFMFVYLFFYVFASDNNVEDMRNTEFLQYDFTTIEVATNYFSDENKLGQGGFGAVYKVKDIDLSK